MGSVTLPSGQIYDCLIVGAGLSGICALHHVRERFPSWHVKVLEAGDSAGGTWNFNRYPGARFDCESITYAYSWDKDLLDEWHWKEAFSPQPETLKYIQRVCQKHDLDKDIQLNTRIKSATWQDDSRTWLFVDEANERYQTRFFLSCIGFLSAPTLPKIPGVKDFQGEAFHTSRWPKNFDLTRDFGGKRIGIIGTGATAIQAIAAIAKEPTIQSLSVFQRTANWSAPLRNSEITAEEMKTLALGFPDMFERCKQTPMAFLHEADPRKSSEVTTEERLALWESMYDKPGFGKWVGVFSDTYRDREANKLYSDFMADKIRSRVNDPVIAEKLVPKTHGFGTRRVPLDSGYFEVYNQSNVHLVDIRETPIEKITKNGIMQVDGTEHNLDVLIYATGFDAITGAFSAIDFHAKDDRPLMGQSGTTKGERAVWKDFCPKTYLGLTVPAMPNMFMVLGPHQPFGNATRSIEHAVDVVVDMLDYADKNHYTYVEPTEEAVEAWTLHVNKCAEGALSNEVDSWMTGVNKNVEGKTVRNVARYAGSCVDFRKRCEEVKSQGYVGLTFA